MAVSFLVYGLLYYYFTTYVIDIEVRQKSVRFAFMFIENVMVVWLLTIISARKGNI